MIIVRTAGGMGNQMFQYATGRALSLKYGQELKIDNYMQQYLAENGFFGYVSVFRSYALDVFTIQASIASPSEIPWWLRVFRFGKVMAAIDGVRRRVIRYKGRESWGAQVFNPQVLSYGPDVYLDGDWQSYKYFEAYSDIIKKDFTLKQLPTESIQELGKEIGSCESVCVHIRRGDYVGNTFHGQMSGAYYTQALMHINASKTIEHVYVFSDDVVWCRDHIQFDYPVTFVDAMYAGEDQMGHFWLMQQCRNFVIANSSFSWWAAWLAENPNKMVVAPKKWFADESIDTTDLIPPAWIRM